MSGWIKLHRAIIQNTLYPTNEKRKFTEYEAWIDILLNTLFKETVIKINNIRVKGKAGEYITTMRELERSWNWSRTKVTSFLDFLKEENQISYKTDKKKTTISVINWQLYQDQEASEKPVKSHRKASKKPAKNHRKTTLDIEECEEGKEGKEIPPIIPQGGNEGEGVFKNSSDVQDIESARKSQEIEGYKKDGNGKYGKERKPKLSSAAADFFKHSI